MPTTTRIGLNTLRNISGIHGAIARLVALLVFLSVAHGRAYATLYTRGFLRSAVQGAAIDGLNPDGQAMVTSRYGILVDEDWFYADAAVELTALLGALTTSTPNYVAQPMWLSQGNTHLGVDTPRLFMELRPGPLTITLGRAPFLQGYTFVFAPPDILYGFDTLAYGDERGSPWIGSVAIEWGFGSRFLVAAIPSIRQADQIAGVARIESVLWEADVALMAMTLPAPDVSGLFSPACLLSACQPRSGYDNRQWLIGGSFARPIGGPMTLRVDGTLAMTGAYRWQPKISAGVDYNGPPNLQLAIEYQWDDSGFSSVADYAYARRSSGQTWTLGEHMLAAFGVYQVTDTDRVRVAGMLNAVDASTSANLEYFRALRQNLELRVMIGGIYGDPVDEFAGKAVFGSAILKLHFGQ